MTSTLADTQLDLPVIQDDQDPLNALDEDYKAASEPCLTLDIEDAVLFSTALSNKQVEDLIGKLAPALARDNDHMAGFIETVSADVHRADPPTFPTFETDSQWWALTNDEMDGLWDEAVHGERRLIDSGIEVPSGLETRQDYLVKPFGSLADPLLVISSYPTADEQSSVHLKYATVNDMSNTSMSRLYAKLGYHNIQERTVGMLHVDIFPRRIDSKKIVTSGERVLAAMPKLLCIYWDTFAMYCIAQSKAMIVILSGHAAQMLYSAYLKERNIPHKMIWAYGSKRTEYELPIAIQEFTRYTRALMSRLVLMVYHAEAFLRTRAERPTNRQGNIATRERLFDFASVPTHQNAPRPVNWRIPFPENDRDIHPAQSIPFVRREARYPLATSFSANAQRVAD